MAVIQYKIREQFVQSVEIQLLTIENMPPAEWVKAKVTFRFWSGFPDISIERSGQEIDDVRRLINDIKDIVNNKVEKVEFYPLEPDYSFFVSKDEDNYKVRVTLDATGTQRTGVYCGFGPTLEIPVTKDDIEQFANDLEHELITLVNSRE